MFFKILTQINIIYTTDIDHYCGANSILIKLKETMIRKYVSDVKNIIIEMENFREKELKSFTMIFTAYVKNYKIEGGNNELVWPLQKDELPDEYVNKRTTSTKLKFQAQVFILKKLFFNDLLFYYYDFCYIMNIRFSKKIDICERKLEKIKKLLSEVREVKEISYEKFGLNSLFEFKYRTFNIYTLSRELVDIVS